MKRLLSLLLLVWLLVPSLSKADLSTLPGGSITHVDCGMNTAGNPICGSLINSYNAGATVSDSSAPYDPPTVYESAREANSTQGGTQLDTNNAPASEYYVGTTIYTSPNFCGYANGGNKINMPGNTYSTSYLHLRGGVDCTTAPRNLIVAFNNQNGATLNNCHYAPNYNGTQAQITGGTIYGDCPGGIVFFPNVNSTNYLTGRWNDLEWCGKTSTTTTSRDGIYAWKLNGETLGYYNQSNTGDAWFVNYHTYTWDGSGAPWGVRAFHRIARHRVATLPAGGCATLMSGTQLPSDTTPPSQVTNLVVTIASSSSIGLSHTAASDNVGIQKYNYEMCTGTGCSDWIAAGSSNGNVTTFTKTGLQPNTSYSFRNKAVDLSGNVSVQYSNVVSRTTPPPNSGVVIRNTLATDNFNRIDSSTLGGNWNWDYYVAGATVSPLIVGNVVRAGIATTKESIANYNGLNLPLDHWASVVLSTWAADATSRSASVQVRAADPLTPSWYQCTASRNNGSGLTAWIERENGNGVYSTLVQTSVTVWAAGDVLLCEAIGMNPTTINMYRNGTLILTTSDANSLTGTRAGIQIYTASVSVVELNDFSEGDFVGTTLPTVTDLTTDASGANVTWAGGPTSIRVTTDFDELTVPIGSFPGGRYTRNWAVGTTFTCMVAVDATGNPNLDTSAYRCMSVTPAIGDATPPTRSNLLPVGALAAGTTTTQLSVQTDESATCKYSLSSGVAYSSMTLAFSSTNGLLHSVTVVGLTNGNTYTYYVRCIDGAGNANPADSVLTFSVNAAPSDTVAPSKVTGLASQIQNANQVLLTFSPATDNVGVTNYLVYICQATNELSQTCPFTLAATGTSSPILVSGLLAGTTYTIKMQAVDAVQNLGTFSDNIELTTPIIDTSKPSRMTGLVATRIAFDTFQLSWNPGTDDQAVLGAAIEVCAGEGCTIFKLQYIATLQTSITIRGLAAQLPYFFRGKHIDIAGNVSEEYSDVAKGDPFPLASGNVQGVCACQVP